RLRDGDRIAADLRGHRAFRSPAVPRARAGSRSFEADPRRRHRARHAARASPRWALDRRGDARAARSRARRRGRGEAMRFYSHPRSSAAYRVQIALNLKGCTHERVSVRFTDGVLDQPGYRWVNAQGFVPALEVDGRVLTQSLVIIEYLDARFPEPKLSPDEPFERAHVRALAQIVACDVHPLHNLRVQMHLTRELGLDSAGVDAWCRRWIAEGFEAFEARIAGS